MIDHQNRKRCPVLEKGKKERKKKREKNVEN